MANPPFPPDGAWARQPSWDPYLAQARDPDEARRALHALEETLSPEWVQARGQAHRPFVLDYAMRVGAFTLIELAVGVQRFRPNSISRRLRAPRDYEAFQAEMQVGLLLHGAGAAARHEPSGGAVDWEAEWPSGERIAVEVKSPQASEDANGRTIAVSLLFMRFMERVGREKTVCEKQSTLCVVDFSMSAIDAVRGADDRETVARELVDAAIGQSLERWPREYGTYSLGTLGTTELRAGIGDTPPLQFEGRPLALDDEYETRRVLSCVRHAAWQAARSSDPGLVVVDVSGDQMMLNSFNAVASSVRSGACGNRLAGAMFVYRQPVGTHAPHCVIHLAPGPAYEVLAPLISSFVHCSRRHLHGDTGIFARAIECSWP